LENSTTQKKIFQPNPTNFPTANSFPKNALRVSAFLETKKGCFRGDGILATGPPLYNGNDFTDISEG
jgi:hypothetical protein